MKKIWQHTQPSTKSVVEGASQFLHQWQEAQGSVTQCVPRPVCVSFQHWEKPEEGRLKCNVDAAVFESQNYSTYGFLLHDHMGGCINAVHAAIPGITHPLLAEAIEFREALSWMKSFSLTNVIVESDCLQLIQMLTQPQGTSSYFFDIVGDCQVLLKEFLSLQFRFIRRSANSVAHCLARAVNSQSVY